MSSSAPDPRIINAMVSVGCSSQEGLWKSFHVKVRDFPALDTNLPLEFSCNGCMWKLLLYHGGHNEAADEYVSMAFRRPAMFEVKVALLDKFGNTKKLAATEGKRSLSVVFIKRSDILDASKNILGDDGTLAIVISVKNASKNPFSNKTPALFLNAETANVHFEVSKVESNEDGSKRTKSCVKFHAHIQILKERAPTLASLFVEQSIVEIADVKPGIFRLLLWYLYGGTMQKKVLKAHAKDIIEAAGKYGVVNLKLTAEAALSNSIKIGYHLYL